VSLVSLPDLKPCPWCGCAMEVREHTKTRSQWRWFVQHVTITVEGCFCDDTSFKERSVEQAVAAWNDRRGETSRAAVLAEASKLLHEWADSDFACGDGTSGDAIRTAAICVRELINPAATQPCGCEGCPTEVPRFWRSAICRDCANEDCEHEDAGEDSTATGGVTP
jgi:hypothetical protein